MKKTLLLAYMAMFISFAMAFLVNSTPPPKAAAPVTGEGRAVPTASPAVIVLSANAAPEPSAEETVQKAESPAPERITLLCGDELLTLGMDEYIANVVAAEMPASFPLEALKAQAVAARSYAMYCAACHRHDRAEVCASYSCCQAWESEEELRESWGASYDRNMARIRDAVSATAGQYLAYGGQPVFAAFHSSSCGRTEDCGEIWSALPYLVSVSSPETGELVPNYVSRAELSPLDFRDTLLSAAPGADFTGEPETWLGELKRDESGRVDSLILGGEEFSGVELRALFSLRSAAFTLEYRGESFIFTVTGFGHGVGMSQYGANAMAASGSDYTQILAHYYPDTMLVG